MKKVVISVAIAAALGAGSFAGFRALNPAERQLSDIELANIEALAFDEGKICQYSKVTKNETAPKLVCEGKGDQCCILD